MTSAPDSIDEHVEDTLARYRRVRRFLAPSFLAAFGLLLLGAMARDAGAVVVAVAVIFALVPAVRLLCLADQRQGRFLADIFLWGFLFRAFLGLVIYYFGLESYTGADSTTYEWYGAELAERWHGQPATATLDDFLTGYNPGIFYWAAAHFYVFGHNLLVVHFVHSVIGAATAILVVRIADGLFGDREISTRSGLFAAFFPSIALWSAQLLKEPLMLFALCLIVYSMQRVTVRFRLRYPVYIVGALLGMLALRFYVFYVMLMALILSLAAPSRPSASPRVVRQLAALALVVFGSVYFVGTTNVAATLEKETQLERIQGARQDQAAGIDVLGRPRGSGFAVEADISTPQGALRHLPVGFLYFMFGPFPWEIDNVRQAIALPEGLYWWLLFPAFLRGLWVALRHRLPESWIILVFSTLLTVVYSLAQGNVGTAYRQRSQVLIFYFILVALGSVWRRRRLARPVADQTRTVPAWAAARRT